MIKESKVPGPLCTSPAFPTLTPIKKNYTSRLDLGCVPQRRHSFVQLSHSIRLGDMVTNIIVTCCNE